MFPKALTISFLLCVCFSINSLAQGQTGFVGEVRLFAGNFIPKGWAYCDGQTLSIAQYQSLFSVLGNMYGGDGRSTFALPNLQGPYHTPTPEALKSTPGGQTVTVSFTNRTSDKINAFWIDWEGEAIYYTDIYVGQEWKVTTGNKQVWRFTNGDKVVDDIEILPGKMHYDIQSVLDSKEAQMEVRYIVCVQGGYPTRN